MRTAETDIRDIKSMMERSSRFISLSGLSGVFAGIYALAGLWIAPKLMPGIYDPGFQIDITIRGMINPYIRIIYPLIVLSVIVLLASVLTAIFFTTRNARKKNQKIWDKRSMHMVWNLLIPLFVGGVFILFEISQGYFNLIVPSVLTFYGLGLINGSKYTFNDIRYLGFFEIMLGLVCLVLENHYLLCLALGFGVLHIVYGAAMYWKYER